MDDRISIDHGDPPVVFQYGDVRMLVMKFPLHNRKLLVVRNVGGMEHAVDRNEIGLDRRKGFSFFNFLDRDDGVSQSSPFSDDELLEPNITLAVRNLFTERTERIENMREDPGLRHIPFQNDLSDDRPPVACIGLLISKGRSIS